MIDNFHMICCCQVAFGILLIAHECSVPFMGDRCPAEGTIIVVNIVAISDSEILLHCRVKLSRH